MEGPQIYLVGLALVLAATVAWSAIAQVDRVVRCEGRIIPAGRSQTIQHLEGGIVSAINAHEGAVVHKGDVLLTIDDTSAEAMLTETRIKLAGQRIRAIRLEAEANGIETMSIPANLQEYRQMVDSEQQFFRARKNKVEQERHIFEEQIKQRSGELREVESRYGRLRFELETARKRLDLISGMASKAAASNLEVLEAQSREQRLVTELSDAELSQPKLHSAIAEAEARVGEARARYRADAQGELSTVQMEVNRLEQTLTTQADRYTRTEIRAPVDGIINRITVNTVGGVVKPGDTLVEITPTTDQVMLEAKAKPSDRGELRTGLLTKVRISAYDVGELGALTGHVQEVSADTVTDAKGEPYYRVVIQVDALPESYANKQIVPGMTITGDVVIGRRTVLKYLTSPFTKFTYNAFRDAR